MRAQANANPNPSPNPSPNPNPNPNPILTRCEHKDITRIANWIEGHLLGTFVKTVMRIISYIDVCKEVLLGLGEYETHNALDNHTDLLLGGLVTNESLYLSLAD